MSNLFLGATRFAKHLKESPCRGPAEGSVQQKFEANNNFLASIIQLPCFEVTPWQADTLLKLRTQSLAGMLNAQQLPTLAQHANQLVKAGKTSAQQAARLEHASA